MADQADDERKRVPKRDARLETFLRRAAPILAAERGLTPGANLKLQALADEMQIPAELKDEAWKLLQQGPPKTRRYSRYERAFAAYLAKQFEGHSNQIVTVEIEQKALRIAGAKYQLEPTQAREILTEIVKKLGLRRISATEAERHVEATAREVVGDAVWVDIETRQRMIELGEEWGVSKEHVATIVEFYCRSNREQARRDQIRSNILVALISILVLTGLGVVMAYTYRRMTDPEADPSIATNDPETKTNSNAFVPLDWWNEGMRTAVGNALARVPGFDAWGRDLASPETSVREAAYQRLITLLSNRHDQPETRRRLEAMLLEIVSAEPDEAVVDRTLDSLISTAKPPLEGLPSGDDFYRRGIATVEFAAALGSDARYDASRRDKTRLKLAELTGTTGAPASADAVTKYRTDYLAVAYERLLAHAASNPSVAVLRFEQILVLGKDSLTEETRGRWATELLVDLLRAAPTEWPRLRALIDVTTSKTNEPNVPALLEFLEAPIDRQLASHLADRLKTNYRLTPGDNSPEEAAAALRRQLGLTSSALSRATPALWNRLVARIPNDSNDYSRLSRRDRAAKLAELAQLASLACRLVVAPDQSAQIDEALRGTLLQLGAEFVPPTPSSETSADPADAADAGSADERTERVIERLNQLSTQQHSGAINTLNLVGQRVSEGVSLEGRTVEATAVARYLLTPRSDAEQNRILETIEPLIGWQDLILALVDELNSPQTRVDIAAKVVGTIRSAGLSLDETSVSHVDLQRQLLEYLLNDLLPRTEERSALSSGDSASKLTLDRILLAAYQQRLSALQTKSSAGTIKPPSDPANPGESPVSRPGESLIQGLHEWYRWSLSTEPKLGETSSYKNFERQLQGDLYLATDDMQAAIAAQRLWVELVATWVLSRHPEHAARIKEIHEAYLKRCASRNDAIEQLLDGEQALLDLWILSR